MADRKYKMLRSVVPFSYSLSWEGEKYPVYRIKALRDIPEKGIRKGDLGGYVSNKFNLSQEGSCWISANAKVVGNVFITEDAHIDNSAVVICPDDNCFISVADDVIIRHSAMVSFNPKMVGSPSNHSSIGGKALICGRAQVRNVDTIYGNVHIRESARLDCVSSITGDVTITGKANIEGRAKISGKTYIGGSSIVEYAASVTDSLLLNDACVYFNETIEKERRGGYPQELIDAGERLAQRLMPETHPDIRISNKDSLIEIETEMRLSLNPMIEAMDFNDVTGYLNSIMEKNASEAKLRVYSKIEPAKIAPVKALTSAPADIETTDALNLLNEIKADIHTYESDIVKIIQYPAMTDRANPFTLEMTAALKRANRLAANPGHKGFIDAVYDLEKKFIAAEANALRVASTYLSELEKKKTDKAKDLIAMAADESSSDNEKELAFTQAFKQLEGIIFVPEVAVDTFRVKIGLKELESRVKENA